MKICLIKKISTKNLYLAALKVCVEKEIINNKYYWWLCSYHYEFEVIKRIILVKKIIKNCYQDIFNKSIYKFEFDDCEIGYFLINATLPAPISAQYITYSEAAKLLARMNREDCEKDRVKENSVKSFQKAKKH